MSKKHIKKQTQQQQVKQYKKDGSFHLEFLNAEQKAAYDLYQKNDIIFLLGPAGSGKTHLAAGFGIASILTKEKSRLVLSRPIVEAGEKLGYLPGTFEEKIAPYLIPLMHCFDDLVGKDSLNREFINKNLEFLPIAYCRGVTFKNCIAVLDEAQNATKTQIKLFLTRLGMNAKVIITGDPYQTDIGQNSGLMEVVESLKDVNGIGIMQFSEKAIVRHPLIPEILKRV